MKTIKVKPWGKDQGDFVLINEEDFNPEFHKLLDEAEPGTGRQGHRGAGKRQPRDAADQ